MTTRAHAQPLQHLIRQIETGLPYSELEKLAETSGLGAPEIAAAIGIPSRTLARRKISGRLASDESERLVRFSRIFDMALGLFERDRGAALQWLTARRRALGGETALAHLRTEVGAREVENLIGRLEHGVFA